MEMLIENILLEYSRAVRINGKSTFDFLGNPNRVSYHLDNKRIVFKYQTELAKLSNTKF